VEPRSDSVAGLPRSYVNAAIFRLKLAAMDVIFLHMME
jgi:hypothetical protein